MSASVFNFDNLIFIVFHCQRLGSFIFRVVFVYLLYRRQRLGRNAAVERPSGIAGDLGILGCLAHKLRKDVSCVEVYLLRIEV